MQAKIQGKNASIGIFDSGFGGLTVMAQVAKLLPHENIIYFGDTGHLPYGSKSPEVVTALSNRIAKFLISKNVKLIIIACNTASAFALKVLQKNYNVPIIGVIAPGAQKAASVTKNGKIGVIGTQGTIKSGSYSKAIKAISKKFNVFETPCPLFVPLAEEGWTKNNITKQIAAIYLKNLINRKIDTLVLGCTHYPLLKNAIKAVTGDNIKLVDSASAAAHIAKQTIRKNKSARKGKYVFYVSDDPKKFAKTGSVFLGKKIKQVTKINLGA